LEIVLELILNCIFLLLRYGKGFGFSINRFVNGVASSFSTQWELEEVMLLLVEVMGWERRYQ
jgi:hypothetical protein